MIVHQDAPKPPMKIFPGFWLRRLEPTGVSDWSPIILSRGESSESNRITPPEGTFGTAGIVWLSLMKKVKDARWWKPQQIRWIKLGFDDEFRPVCLLAPAESYLSPGLFKDALGHRPDERHRHRMFEDSWITSEGGVPCWIPSFPRARWFWQKGYSVLRSSRDDKFDYEITTLDLAICIRKYKDLTMAPQDSRSDCQEQSVWVVDI